MQTTSWIWITLAVSGWFATSLTPVANANGTRLQTIVEVGDNVAGNHAVTAIGSTPRIDSAGNVVVVALLRDDAASRPGILRASVDAVELVVRAGDGVPDATSRFVSLSGEPMIDGGRVFFTASMQEPHESFSRKGTWSAHSGIVERVVLEGDSLPGTPQGAVLADWDLSVRDDGRVVLLRGRFAEGSSIPADSRSLWRRRNGIWEPIVVSGLPAPGVGGATFGGPSSGSFGSVFAFGADGTGRVVAQSWISGRRIDANNDEGLWRESASDFTLFVREGARVDGKGKATFGPSSGSPTFGGFGENIPLVTNAAGVVAFGAVIRESRGRLNSLWTTRAGAPQRLLSGALPLDGYGEGDPAPGLAPAAKLATFTFAALNDRQTIAFEGFADEFNDFFRLTEGVWWDATGSFTLATATGQAAPLLPGATVSDVQLEALDESGSILVTAQLQGQGVSTMTDRVLYRFASDRTPNIVLREGSSVQVVGTSGAVFTRNVATFAIGRGASANGSRALFVQFTDGSSGIYLLSTLDNFLMHR